MKRLLIIITLLLAFTISALAFDPGTYDMVIQAGEDYQLTMALYDPAGAVINLTGYSYAAQFRSAPAPAGAVYANYSAYSPAPANGQVRVKLSHQQTVALSGKSGTWDLRQTDPSGLVSYLLFGKVAVKPTSTR